jgi:biopolymer transport protein TolR
MAFHTPSDEQEAMSEINVTPLVDVMLVLLVVFIVTAPLLTQTVRVNLPKTAATEASSSAQPLQLSIDLQGLVTLNNRLMKDMIELESVLREERRRNSEAAIHLYVDQNVSYAVIAKVMAATQRAGIAKLAFVTVPE